ncbi:MAG TPA: ABC transporter substrate-binding protein [Acidimicrobiales bacterium]|nr:ABC transporter substrate-binding protein [Acidimicrobiales bacterium]
MRRRLLPTVALLAVLSLVVAACGQKSGVHVATGGNAELASDGLDGEAGAVDAEGNPIDGGTGAVDAAGNPITGSATGSAGGSAGGRSTTRRVAGGSGGTATDDGDDGGGGGTATTKVWGKTITIGIHAPITGAAPLPSTFQSAANFVKNYYNARGGIHGRSLEIEIVDDQYQPAVATQRCQELVKQRNAFLLIGAAGTDQIQACARYAATAAVPYLSAGVTEKGLTRLKNYFAISMSYRAQVPYLVQYMKQQWPDKAADPSKVFMVYSDTPNFGDAVAAWQAALPGAKTIKLSRVPSQSELNAAARQLCDARATIAFPLMAPKDWLFVIGGQPTGCTPQWAGIGVTMGVNEVAKNACRSSGDKFIGSTFFSPFPGKDKAPGMDADFKAGTSQGANASQWDDIWVALWGTTKGMVMLLDRVGPELTRAKFVTTMESTTGLNTGLGPVLSYAPGQHFGALQVHVLKATCTGSSGAYSGGEYTTPTIFLEY